MSDMQYEIFGRILTKPNKVSIKISNSYKRSNREGLNTYIFIRFVINFSC